MNISNIRRGPAPRSDDKTASLSGGPDALLSDGPVQTHGHARPGTLGRTAPGNAEPLTYAAPPTDQSNVTVSGAPAGEQSDSPVNDANGAPAIASPTVSLSSYSSDDIALMISLLQAQGSDERTYSTQNQLTANQERMADLQQKYQDKIKASRDAAEKARHHHKRGGLFGLIKHIASYVVAISQVGMAVAQGGPSPMAILKGVLAVYAVAQLVGEDCGVSLPPASQLLAEGLGELCGSDATGELLAGIIMVAAASGAAYGAGAGGGFKAAAIVLALDPTALGVGAVGAARLGGTKDAETLGWVAAGATIATSLVCMGFAFGKPQANRTWSQTMKTTLVVLNASATGVEGSTQVMESHENLAAADFRRDSEYASADSKKVAAQTKLEQRQFDVIADIFQQITTRDKSLNDVVVQLLQDGRSSREQIIQNIGQGSI